MAAYRERENVLGVRTWAVEPEARRHVPLHRPPPCDCAGPRNLSGLLGPCGKITQRKDYSAGLLRVLGDEMKQFSYGGQHRPDILKNISCLPTTKIKAGRRSGGTSRPRRSEVGCVWVWQMGRRGFW